VKNQDYKTACSTLKLAIEIDIENMAKINKKPSIRLYDLLAGLSVRYDQMKYLEFLNDLIISLSKKTVGFDDPGIKQLSARLKICKHHESSWYKHWQDRTKKLKWGGGALLT
jgi:hypothetical protein